MRRSMRLTLAMAALVLVTAAAVGFFTYRGIEETILPIMPRAAATAALAIGRSTLVVGVIAGASEVIKRIRAMLAKHEREDVALDLNEIVHEVLALTRNEQHARHVAVEARLAAGLPPVRGDRIQLQQAVLNLVMNAIEAMSMVADRPRLLRLASRLADGGDVLVAVEDTGSGIDPSTAERLFEPFYTTKAGGMGMGLAITRSIVEDHGGRLWSMPGAAQGALFLFTLSSAKERVA